jgi:GNAT superfamily N-acetyltransferase
MVSRVETNPRDFSDFLALRGLLVACFAHLDGRIDPPSSLHRLTPDDLSDKTRHGDLFLVREADDPVACLFGEVRGAAYYIGKLAVAKAHRGRGLARACVAAAGDVARARGCTFLELQSRIEVSENHATFRALGFTEAGRTSHPGYMRPTSITFRRPVPPDQARS